MTPRERFLNILNFRPVDKMPKIEWAAWWNMTVDRWYGEGLDRTMNYDDVVRHFGMDNFVCLTAMPSLPAPKAYGLEVIENEDDYEEIRKTAYSDSIIEGLVNSAKAVKAAHDRGELSIRIWLDGFFWYPRRLFGIQNHLYAFYDYPELMHKINRDLADFNKRAINALYDVLVPELFGMAEDMSYNHGPMISEALFDEFLLPYYKDMVKTIKTHDTKVFIDSDGDITTMIPWMRRAGIEGVYPLERQAGVDLCEIRRQYPDFLMLGGYDKMVMPLGEKEMRAEFERLLPVWQSGGYILSVDHQTPPGVSLENYGIYARLYEEYSNKI